MPRYWVYIVRCSDGSLYTGCSSDIKRRLVQHNSGKASKYTRSRLPVTLSYLEKTSSRSSALKRESKIKNLNRSSKLLLCSGRLSKTET
ncbi:MAG: GIY-YIG nuclease family protein [Thaumarchaeota archaeon]|nr:GIY-YIG nuclease family protein [Nitrososphaerota archaeon]